MQDGRFAGSKPRRIGSRLLRAGDLPIEDVARRCGFPNRYYFTRMFSKHRHMTPAAYRRGSGG